MTQTSSGIFNTSLFSEVTPRSLLAWHRVCMANREWAHVFSQYNAGDRLPDGPPAGCRSNKRPNYAGGSAAVIVAILPPHDSSGSPSYFQLLIHHCGSFTTASLKVQSYNEDA